MSAEAWGVQSRWMRNYEDDMSRDQTGIAQLGIGTGDFTISLFVMAADATAGSDILQINGDTNARTNATLVLYRRSGDTRIYINGVFDQFATGAWAVGEIHHAVVRRQSGTVGFWWDGVQDASTASYSDDIADADVWISGELEANANLSHAAIWNRALTEPEIKRLAQQHSPLEFSQNLKAYWPLQNDLRDHVGTAHVTSTTGTPTWNTDGVPLLQRPRIPQYWPVVGAAPPAARRVFVIS